MDGCSVEDDVGHDNDVGQLVVKMIMMMMLVLTTMNLVMSTMLVMMNLHIKVIFHHLLKILYTQGKIYLKITNNYEEEYVIGDHQ